MSDALVLEREPETQARAKSLKRQRFRPQFLSRAYCGTPSRPHFLREQQQTHEFRIFQMFFQKIFLVCKYDFHQLVKFRHIPTY
jgi:hypothetical protein